jgi:hypothetical protein
VQDDPTPNALLEIVSKYLRDEVLSEIDGAVAFQLRVAANALDLVKREIEESDTGPLAERNRLRELLGYDGTVHDLTRELARRIREGTVTMEMTGLMEHLWLTACAKVCVDQPNYAGLSRARDLWMERERAEQENKAP